MTWSVVTLGIILMLQHLREQVYCLTIIIATAVPETGNHWQMYSEEKPEKEEEEEATSQVFALFISLT